MKVMISANSAWNLLNFRAGLINALVDVGHEVVLVAPKDKQESELRALGANFVEMPLQSHTTNPLIDLSLLVRYILLIRRERPDVILTYTVKPNIYGSVAGMIMGCSVINNIAGLGSAFIKSGWITSLLKLMYQFSLRKSYKVFFQNPDDLNLFVQLHLLNSDKVDLVPGSGVDLKKFSFKSLNFVTHQETVVGQKFVFLMVARLLKDKGIFEYAEASRILKKSHPNVEVALLGVLDESNPNSVSSTQISGWLVDGVISYWGESDDVREHLEKADCVVLPSYREGTPRALLEAAAMGRPLIATDVPGCREAVQNSYNGFLCRVNDAEDLAEKMISMVSLSVTAIKQMGINSRELAEKKFNEKIVIQKYLDLINELA